MDSSIPTEIRAFRSDLGSGRILVVFTGKGFDRIRESLDKGIEPDPLRSWIDESPRFVDILFSPVQLELQKPKALIDPSIGGRIQVLLPRKYRSHHVHDYLHRQTLPIELERTPLDKENTPYEREITFQFRRRIRFPFGYVPNVTGQESYARPAL